MHPILAVVPALLLAAVGTHAGATHAGDHERTHYLELINRAHDSVTSLAVTAAGGDAFREIDLGAPLRGGGGSSTIEVPGEGCRYDFRFDFRDGRSLVYRNVDVCRSRALRIRPMSRAD